MKIGQKIKRRKDDKVFVISGVKEMHLKKSLHYVYWIKPYNGVVIKMPYMDDILHKQFKKS